MIDREFKVIDWVLAGPDRGPHAPVDPTLKRIAATASLLEELGMKSAFQNLYRLPIAPPEGPKHMAASIETGGHD